MCCNKPYYTRSEYMLKKLKLSIFDITEKPLHFPKREYIYNLLQQTELINLFSNRKIYMVALLTAAVVVMLLRGKMEDDKRGTASSEASLSIQRRLLHCCNELKCSSECSRSIGIIQEARP